jgi:hypothetical protein
MKIKREHIILMIILLFGIFVRLVLFRNETFIGDDGANFMRLGKNLIEHGNYSFGEDFNMGIFSPPGYPAFIGLTNLLVKDLFLSGKLISLFSSIITIFLFYLIGKELHNKEAGLFAAFAYAVYPYTLFLTMSVTVQSEAMFLCLFFLSIYLFIVMVRRDNFLIYTLFGISSAIAYLTRPEGVYLLLLPCLHLFYGGPIKKERLFKVSFVILIFILIASPYILFLKSSTGKLSLSGKINQTVLQAEVYDYKDPEGIYYNPILFSLNKDKTHLKLFDENTTASLINYISKDPSDSIRKYKKNFLEQIKLLIKLLIPVMLPLFFSFFSRDLFKNKSKLIFILLPLPFLMVYPLFFIMERLVFPVLLLLILFSSVGFVNSTSILSNLFDFYEIKRGRITSFLIKNIKYIIIIMLGVSYLLYVISFWERTPHVEHSKAGYFLKKNVSSEYEKLNVMSRMPWVSFYSDARYTRLPYAHYNDVINYAKLYKVDYIVIDERRTGEWDVYNELVQMDKYSDDIELIYEDHSGKLIRIFKIRYE